MRNFLLALGLISSISFNSNAQIDGGTMMAGGSAYFNTRFYNGNSSTSLQIQPQFGLAFADNFIAGAWFNVGVVGDISSWGVSPFVRYYMNNAFVELGYGYNQYDQISSSVLSAELGYAMFFNDYVALEPALYYNHNFVVGADPIDVGFKMGFQVYFNR